MHDQSDPSDHDSLANPKVLGPPFTHGVPYTPPEPKLTDALAEAEADLEIWSNEKYENVETWIASSTKVWANEAIRCLPWLNPTTTLLAEALRQLVEELLFDLLIERRDRTVSEKRRRIAALADAIGKRHEAHIAEVAAATDASKVAAIDEAKAEINAALLKIAEALK